MAFDRAAAIAEGYTEDEINAYLQAEAEKQKAATPVVADVGEPPAPTTKIEPVGSSVASVGTSGALALAPYAIPAAGAAAAAYGGGKLYSGWQTANETARELGKVSAQNAAQHAATQEMKLLQQMAKQGGQGADFANQRLQELLKSRVGAPTGGVPTGPIAPTGAAPTGPIAPAAPTAAPMAQAAENVAARAPSMLDKTTAMIRQLAASKVMDVLGKGMTGLQLATYSPELGPKTPQTGRMRGSEINQLTGRPWTPEQLAQYNANPDMFDRQLPPPQFR